MNELNKIMPADGILVADGGFAAHWGGLMFDTKAAGRHFLPDRGFASIGYGVPGGIGAQLAAGPKRRVVSLTGDGGFNMSLGELETARRVGASFVAVVFNNAASGYVKALQHAVYGQGAYQSSDLVEMNYAKIAEGFGCHGIRVTDPEKLSAALHEGLENTDDADHPRRRRHPRSLQDAARRRQPRRADREEGRPAGLMASEYTYEIERCPKPPTTSSSIWRRPVATTVRSRAIRWRSLKSAPRSL